MRRFLKIYFLIVGVLLSSIASAGVGWTGKRKILNLESHSGGMEIFLEGGGDACTPWQGKIWTKLDINNQNYKNMAALAILAFSTGKPVDIYCNLPADYSPAAHIKL